MPSGEQYIKRNTCTDMDVIFCNLYNKQQGSSACVNTVGGEPLEFDFFVRVRILLIHLSVSIIN